MRIAVDVMGADQGPAEIIAGALAEASSFGQLILVGDRASIEPLLRENSWDKHDTRVSLCHASQVIGMAEHPLAAVRSKGDSSLVVSMRMLGDREVDAVVTPGNTGAALAAGALHVGRIDLVDRPAIAAFVPNKTGRTVLIDGGASVDCRPEHLYQFAFMGSAYAETALGIKNPVVGLLNIGEESTKGNQTLRETFPLLENSSLNFAGNVEGRQMFSGEIDVVVTDGFVGNMILKSVGGFGWLLASELKSVLSENLLTRLVVAGFMRGPLRRLNARIDWREYGGAPLLGINGVCIIAHGASNARAIAKAIQLARETTRGRTVESITETLGIAFSEPDIA